MEGIMKKIGSSLRKSVVVTMSILMCLNILQTEVFSLEEDKQENYVMNKYEESKEINEEEIEYEIEERRTSHTRFFKMKDGEVIGCSYNYEIAKKEEDGKYLYQYRKRKCKLSYQ